MVMWSILSFQLRGRKMVGRLKFHANVARFKREFMKGSGNADKMENVLNKSKPNRPHKEVGRLVWVEVDGIPFKFLSGPTFKQITAKWGELLDVDDNDETNFHSKRFCILTKVCENMYESFKIVFRGKVYWVRASEVPGWTPEFFEEEEEDNLSVEGNNDGKPNVHEVNNDNKESDMDAVLETVFDEPDEQKDNQSKDPFGFTPDGDLNEGNVAEGHAMKVYGENERGDNLVVNLEVGIDILIVVDYAPQEAKEKRMLWDYLSHVSNQWDGKIVMMGDFNEVRYKSDRFGSNFNAHDAEIFNSFIYNAGLEEVSLGGSAYWLEVKGFDKLVRDSWNVSIHTMNSRGEISLLKEELRSCDEIIDKGECSREVVHKCSEILNKIHQKCSQSNIRGVMVNGTWVDDPIQVKPEFFDHFRGRFDKPSKNQVCIDISFLNSLSNDQKEDLERKIKKRRLKGLCGIAALISLRVRMVFRLAFIVIFGQRLNRMPSRPSTFFFMHGDMPNGCNSNFIALIPKILDANMVKDFRPISLIGSLYKIIAKILANRLVGVLDDLVNEVQSAFVVDRQILDGPFILNEASGLRINMCKSKIISVNVVDGKVKNTDVKLGCLVLKTPFTYLGTKVGDIMSRKHAWKEVVDKVLFRLFRWKMKILSIGVPSSILKTLESICSRFFNGQDPKSKKASWVKWNNVLTPKDKGGLWVSSLYALNRGLMLKWVWRFYSQKRSLWTKVIKAIHGEDGSLDKDGIGVVWTCWTSIVQECEDRSVWTLESDEIFSVASIQKEIDGKRF
nr:RNA-directed DNA polymerase, eukaryota [Tanacetum cinerariifolium]